MEYGEFRKFLKETYDIPHGNMNKFLRAIKFPRVDEIFTYREAYLYCITHKELIDFYLL